MAVKAISLSQWPVDAALPTSAAASAPNWEHLSILYRGPLSSCNYQCPYCPFAKRRESRAQLAADRRALIRFVEWINAHDRVSVFFTPWGEALVRSWYRESIIRLSRMSQVRRVAIQTNLSCKLDWLEACNRESVALWSTYHPGEVPLQRFLERCRRLDSMGIRYSVGVVGLKEHLDQIEALRGLLNPNVYLWVNAYKRVDDYYADADVARIEAIDPLFRINMVRHKSMGKACRTGESVVSVNGDGVVSRCHFISEPLGNIYVPGWEASLKSRSCSNETCGCHIGYVHMQGLSLYEVFGAGVIERIPARPVWQVGEHTGLVSARGTQVSGLSDPNKVIAESK